MRSEATNDLKGEKQDFAINVRFNKKKLLKSTSDGGRSSLICAAEFWTG